MVSLAVEVKLHLKLANSGSLNRLAVLDGIIYKCLNIAIPHSRRDFDTKSWLPGTAIQVLDKLYKCLKMAISQSCRDHGTTAWLPGTVTQGLNKPRSYIILSHACLYICNMRHLRCPRE